MARIISRMACLCSGLFSFTVGDFGLGAHGRKRCAYAMCRFGDKIFGLRKRETQTGHEGIQVLPPSGTSSCGGVGLYRAQIIGATPCHRVGHTFYRFESRGLAAQRLSDCSEEEKTNPDACGC